MGWRYRKSINLGLGFRINISKSGIGYSWGGPGYRKTWKANGGIRETYSIPGTGISYVEEHPSPNVQSNRLPRANSMERYNLENSKSYPIVNGKIDALSTPENKLFVDKIKSIKLKNFFTWLIGGIILLMWACLEDVISENLWTPIGVCLMCAVLGLCFFINSRRFVVLEYNIESDVSNIIDKRNDALAILSCCSKIWNIEEYSTVAYSRVNAGAGVNFKRKLCSFIYKKPPRYLKIIGDLKVYQLKIGTTEYIFLPDKILVVGFLQVGALRYHDILLNIENSFFVEEESKPSDSVFLYNTWQYVNNNGTPDRRFKNNRQLPVYEYAKLSLKSATGLNLYLLLSSMRKAKMFKEEWSNIQDIF